MKSDNKLALFFRKIGKRLKEDKVYSRTFYSIIAVLIALIVVIIVSVSCSKKEDNGADNEISANSVSENQTAGTVDYTVPDVALAEDAYADVNALVNQYFAAMTTGDTAAITAMKDTAAQEDLIKIENVFLTEEQVNQLSLYAPKATVNRIDNYEVVLKLTPTLPEQIDHVLDCPNSNCISRSEPVSSSFKVRVRQDEVLLKCKYCEKEFEHHAVMQNA